MLVVVLVLVAAVDNYSWRTTCTSECNIIVIMMECLYECLKRRRHSKEDNDRQPQHSCGFVGRWIEKIRQICYCTVLGFELGRELLFPVSLSLSLFYYTLNLASVVCGYGTYGE